jgi:hypothetical protein
MARQYFQKTGWTQRDSAQGIELLAFYEDKEFESYRLQESAYAFYKRCRQGDYIVMRDLEPEHYAVAIHEYTHSVVEHSGLNLPVWLNEGLADFYSTLECRQAKVLVGTAPEGRDFILQDRRWMDWAVLAAVDEGSPYYREPEKMLLFYAQSWAMVHMLAMEPAYADGFPKFLAAVSGGATADAALWAIYHKTLQQVGGEVVAYARSRRMKAHWVTVDARPGSVEMQVVAEPAKRAEFALAEVLAADPETAGEAKIRLVALSARYPSEPRAKESLGFLAIDAGLEKEAQQDFADANVANTRDPDVLFQLAHWKRATDGPSDEVIALLQRAVAVDSTHYKALMELGFAAANREKYELAVRAFETINQPRPEHAYVVSYMLAYCLVELRQANKARSYAQHASEIASNAKDRDQVAALLRSIDRQLPAELASR